jgi:hypothetical protein
LVSPTNHLSLVLRVDRRLISIDISTSAFPGLLWSESEKRIYGPQLREKTHPHLRLGEAMVSMPRVEPGDMVFWHCVSSLRNRIGRSIVYG